MTMENPAAHLPQLHHWMRYVNLLLCLILGLSLPLAGQAADVSDLAQAYLPLLMRRVPFIESQGILDPSFSEDGLVLTNLSGSTDSGSAVILLRDGKLLVGGEIAGQYSVDVGVARYNPDGSLDTTFSDNGWVSTELYGDDEAAAIAVQPDGKILLGCTAVSDFFLVRYNSDGTLDLGFGTYGKVRTDFLGYDDEAKAVAVQSDGRIVMAGYAMTKNNDFDYDYDFALARYLPDGSLDPSFGEGGKVTTELTDDHDQARAIAIQPDGRIVVVGPSKHTPYFHDFALVRYNTDGSLDASFGEGGKVFTDFAGNHDFAYAVALLPDGRIIVVGGATIEDYYDFAIARYTPNGNLDTTFGGDGRVVTYFGAGDDYGYAVALQPDGKVIVGGYAFNGANSDFALARYLPDGSLDITFSGNGMLVTDLAGGDDKGLAIALQLDGKIALAGNAFNGLDTDFALARYK